MALAFAGNGTITGLSVGGLPDGTVDADTLASGVGGKVLQVLSTTKDDTWDTTSSSWVDVTGMSVDITPSATSSKILVTLNMMISQTGTTNRAYIRLLRDSTAIHVGASAGNRTLGTAMLRGEGTQYSVENFSVTYLDSPSSTSALTYKAQGGVFNTAGMAVNRDGQNDDDAYTLRGASTITVMEISA